VFKDGDEVSLNTTSKLTVDAAGATAGSTKGPPDGHDGTTAGSTKGPDSGHGGVNRCPPTGPPRGKMGGASSSVKGGYATAPRQALDTAAVAPP